MSFSEESIRQMVRKVLLRTLGPDGIAGDAGPGQTTSPSRAPGSPPAASRPVVSKGRSVTEADVLATPKGGRLAVPADAVITPLAVDAALDRKVTLVREQASSARSAVATPSKKAVAVGADHGGYPTKEDLKGYLEELGYEVIDCGTHSADSVDYPDLAYAVAALVSDGRAWRGIVVDGAGIGSCMAANKVPGVRAAMCYDHATAVNSREHNDANVLSLGGMLLGRALTRQIVKVWLETEFGGGRHGRRVDKIMDIEKRFTR